MEFEYIIVGAGSAGCVLAERLSGDSGNRVLLLEAGPENNALSLKIPAAMLSNLKSTRHNWAFRGEPEPALNGRRITHDRGKGIGGSSSINGMVFIRGHALDFEGWRQAGCEGWGYADVLPYFKRMESYGRGGDGFRGDRGPLNVHRPTPENPIALAFLEAGREAGYPATDDINGYRQEGFGLLDSSVHRGERWSAARAYLDPARERPNLTIETAARVQRIVLEGDRAVGVKYRQRGAPVTARASREVILSAGAVGSPHLLMLSGIGPGAQLQNAGIEVVLDLPGVGQNLNDHPDFVLKYKCLKPCSIWPKTRMVPRTVCGIQWLLTRGGICASNHFDVVACIRSEPGITYPDIQLTISPVALDDETWSPIPEHAFQVHLGLMRTYSRGRIELRDENPESPPRILANYLHDGRDRGVARRGVRLVRELVGQPAFSDLRGMEIFPGEKVQSDAEVDQALNAHINTQWHLSGTARMGADTDRDAVVDASGRVHGVRGLRVVDASIMPYATNGNTNCPVLMIAEKLGDAIAGHDPLPPVQMEIWQHPDPDNRQR